MTPDKIKFADLLREGVYQIHFRESKPISVIHDELGYALKKKGGSMIEYWRKGNIPSKSEDVGQLARQIVARGELDQTWLSNFLAAAAYPYPEPLINEIFQSQDEMPSSRSERSSQSAETASTTSNFVNFPTNYLPDPAPLPKGSIVPWRRNPHFVGRRADLLGLAASFHATNTISISQVETTVSTGLGGIGKTQLASEFVHRYGQFFDGGVFWLSFELPEAIPSEIAACGDVGRMELRPDFARYSQEEQIRLVMAEWSTPTPRLLVFDNCEDPELLERWRPKTGGCRILVTSRRGDWEAVLGVRTRAIGVLAREESLELLRKHCPSGDQAILDQIAEELGDLPLALHLAGRYLNVYERILKPADYLKQLQDPLLLRHPSLSEGGLSPTGHVQHVGRTFALSYDQLQTADLTDQLARRLLVHSAHFAPGEPIWYRLLVKTVISDPDKLEDAVQVDNGFRRLIEIGLVESQGEILKMHRLVAKFVRDVAKEEVETSQKAVEEVVFEETRNMNKAVYPTPLLEWQLHLRSVADIAQARHDEEGAQLCSELAQHLLQISDYEGSLSYYRKALEIRLNLLGENHKETAESLAGVGRALQELNQSKEALTYFKRSLAVRETLLGKWDLDTADSYEKIGLILWQMGKPKDGIDYIKVALEIIQVVIGNENARSAECHNNIGLCLYNMGQTEEALTWMKKAVKINEQVQGLNHPHTALNKHNVGYILMEQQKFSEAEIYLREGLEVRKEIYGFEQKDTIISINALGTLMVKLARYDEAEALAVDGLRYGTAVLGRDHFSLSFSHHILGQVFVAKGDFEQAKSHLGTALKIRQDARGEAHPYTQLIQDELDSLN